MGRARRAPRSPRPSAATLGLVLGLAALAPAGGCFGPGPEPAGGAAALLPGTSLTRPWAARAASGAPAPLPAAQAEAVEPEPATPHALAVRWPIRGDHNGNAVVDVAYRPHGETEWRAGLPLFWVHPRHAPEAQRVPDGRLFAGSIVDLEPDTAYEVRLALRDPDGGSQTRTLNLRTTREPVQPPDLATRHVVPAAGAGAGPGSGSRSDPFVGLEAALARAEPGQLILLHAGRYRAGDTRLAHSGAAGRPIVLRGAGDGEVVLDGEGRARLLDLSGLRHVWIEHLTLRNADTLLQARGASHLVVRRNRFEVRDRNLAVGLEARHARGDESRGFFVTDNVFLGPNPWPRRAKAKSAAERIFGVAITGAGHVVAYNLMRGLGDGVNNGRGGWLSASDIHNNDIYDATDDCIEADHSTTNLRVFRNRLTNCFAGVSAQPIHGGPAYVFRNLILNTQYSPFKLHNHTSGLLLLHNTSVKAGIPFKIQPARETVNDVLTRNNIFIGTEGPALRSTGRMIRCDFDNDGYGWDWGPFALWNGVRYASHTFVWGSSGPYANLGAVTLATQGEFASGLAPPADTRRGLDPARNDPRLAPDSKAVDAGVVLPNFSERYRGAAPDLGCCELGEALPHFGPRPEPGT